MNKLTLVWKFGYTTVFWVSLFSWLSWLLIQDGIVSAGGRRLVCFISGGVLADIGLLGFCCGMWYLLRWFDVYGRYKKR